MFARSRRKYADDCFFPELERFQEAASFFHFALLLAKNTFHFALIIHPEIERKYANQGPKQLLGKRQGLFFHESNPSLCQFWFSEKFLGARLSECFFHAFRLGDCHLASKFRKQVVAAPLIIKD